MQAEGLVVVSAAGNHDDYACDRSPAGALASVTVGATQMDDTKVSTPGQPLPPSFPRPRLPPPARARCHLS